MDNVKSENSQLRLGLTQLGKTEHIGGVEKTLVFIRKDFEVNFEIF